MHTEEGDAGGPSVLFLLLGKGILIRIYCISQYLGHVPVPSVSLFSSGPVAV